MSKKELRNVVKEVYDRAVLEGNCEFSDKYTALHGMSVEARCYAGQIVAVSLEYGSGYLYLRADSNTRKRIIDIFTDFIWIFTDTD